MQNPQDSPHCQLFSVMPEFELVLLTLPLSIIFPVAFLLFLRSLPLSQLAVFSLVSHDFKMFLFLHTEDVEGFLQEGSFTWPCLSSLSG